MLSYGKFDLAVMASSLISYRKELASLMPSNKGIGVINKIANPVIDKASAAIEYAINVIAPHISASGDIPMAGVGDNIGNMVVNSAADLVKITQAVYLAYTSFKTATHFAKIGMDVLYLSGDLKYDALLGSADSSTTRQYFDQLLLSAQSNDKGIPSFLASTAYELSALNVRAVRHIWG